MPTTPRTGAFSACRRVSLFDVDFSGANVLSISTLEHVGTGDYGLGHSERSSPDALAKLIAESAMCTLGPCANQIAKRKINPNPTANATASLKVSGRRPTRVTAATTQS